MRKIAKGKREGEDEEVEGEKEEQGVKRDKKRVE